MKEYRTKGLFHKQINEHNGFELFELSDEGVLKGFTILYSQTFVKSFYTLKSATLYLLNSKRSIKPEWL